MANLPGKEFEVSPERLVEVEHGERSLSPHEQDVIKSQSAQVIAYLVLQENIPEAVADRPFPTFEKQMYTQADIEPARQ